MCLINFNIGSHDKYKMIIAANRDEFYSRPTAPVHYWEDHPNILGGRDLKAQGTWLAVSKSGKISALTNIRTPEEMTAEAKKSRGELVVNYLLSEKSPKEYLTALAGHSSDYAGFNLLTGTPDELYYMNNYDNKISRVTDGTHGLSNEYLDTPWPKVVIGKEQLDKVISEDDIDIDALFSLLRIDTKAADDIVQQTGVDAGLEKKLSPLFIDIPDFDYGTRCSTVVLVDRQNNITLIERTFKNGVETGEITETISVNK
ncbi:hypothetical protein GCM10007275_20240 [Jeotgalicoccus coquinae]|uniref:Uncharacterized protein with NRDE domain n=1 Tax=Jeotgalicoccus coquinae TaxID=709509 RepID=A0A6V7RRL3_9STAP|nr:NRDE family protein [Jeotgalicoccus coquinae]MBB6424272.1 uncharacterized protein with NRDE domain [Jeotgalicoccus coquinae]GGE25140.1 hypothetical protein GCM10007275_20240 [Jeotgalicoccus coquinae]CAD2081617.1 hypothetical protein JEOCOQ751_02063 [Jeotgalicoccus coquinae]